MVAGSVLSMSLPPPLVRPNDPSFETGAWNKQMGENILGISAAPLTTVESDKSAEFPALL